MKYLTLAFLLASGPAWAMCGTHEQIAENLRLIHGENVQGLGVTTAGYHVEVFAAPDGTWTLVGTGPDGVACMIDGGSGWVPVLVKISS